MIYLDRNENNYGPAPACLEVLHQAEPSTLSSYTKAYKRGVKSALSERLANDFRIDEKQVLLGYGAEDILKQVVQCYLGPGQKLMIPAYSWWYYKAIADEVDGENLEYPLLKGDDSFHYDLNTMLQMIEEHRPQLVFVSSPNNPTGNSIEQNDLQMLLKNLQDTIVVLDEAYWYRSENHHIIKLISEFPNLVIIRTFSKYYALAGIRIGFALAGKSLEKLIKLSNRYLGYSVLSEQIALAALDSPDYYRKIAEKMDSDRHHYYTELGKIQQLRVFKSDANFILVEMPKPDMEPLKKKLTEKNLVIKFMNEEVLNSHMRITLGTEKENQQVIETIKAFYGV